MTIYLGSELIATLKVIGLMMMALLMMYLLMRDHEREMERQMDEHYRQWQDSLQEDKPEH